MKPVKPVVYFTWKHNVEGCLGNGSYVRKDSDGVIVQYMNGDYMGEITKVPAGMVEVSTKEAKDMLPKCCN